MNLDPVDFFPGYDPYFCCQRQPRHSTIKSICTHFLVMLFTAGICGAAFFCYDNYKNLNFDFYQDGESSVLQTSQSNYNFDEMKQEMEKIKESLEDTINWRKQLTDLFTKIYVQQESVIEQKIDTALDIYDSDKIGLFDYASTYSCASIVGTPDTYPYPANKSITFFNLLNVDLLSNPEALLQPSNFPGNCFAFYGSNGRIRIRLGKKINIKSVTIDHIKMLEDASSAPKEFEVFGLYDPIDDVGGILLGKFTYNLEGRPYQTFAINQNWTNIPFEFVELHILSNYGRREFTCVYRFRVHSTYPPVKEH